MALAHKPPTGLPGSMAIHLPAFKRKRIEQWCDDVATYLRAGSLCRSVIGHVIEDNRSLASQQPSTGVKSAPPGHSRTTSQSIGTMTDLTGSSSKHDVAFKVTKIECTAPPAGRGTPMPDASGPLPVVKFSYSHYNEQRRKMDRLVQGLPVLSAPGSAPNTGADRVNQNGAVVYINGEEPIRKPGFGSAGSGRERAERVGRTSARASPVPASRSSSGEPRLRNSVPQPSGNHVRTHSQSPGPSPGSRNHTTQPHTLHINPGSRVTGSSEIVVIEDSFHHHHQNIPSTGFRTGALPGGNFTFRRSANVHKARQKIMSNTRKSTSQERQSSTHLPVQNCWAMAELTW